MPVRKRGQGWQAEAYLGDAGPLMGLPKRVRSDGHPTEAEAEAWVQDMLQKRQEALASARSHAEATPVPEQGRLPAPDRPMGLGDLLRRLRLDRWASTRDPSLDKRIGHILDHFGEGRPVHTISEEDLLEFRNRLAKGSFPWSRKGASRTTWSRYRAILSPALEEAAALGAILVRPRLPKGAQSRSRTRVLSDDETTSLLEHLRERSLDAFEVWSVMLGTGCRNSEVFRLRGMDVAGSPARIIVRGETKNGVVRELPVASDLFEMLQRRAAEVGPRGFLFASLSSDHFQKLFSKAKEGAGLGHEDEVVPYTARHTYGTRLASKLPTTTVQRAMGHRGIGMTSRYVHLASDVLFQEDVLDIINRK